MSDKIRAFLAVNFSVATTRAMAELEEAVRKETPPELRIAWVPAANLHVTLKFLGWTREEALPAIQDRVGKEISGYAPFDVRAKGLGTFPTPTSPRVVWIGLEDAGGTLGKLAAGCEQWMSDLGFIKEERPFRPHVTIGRVKDGKGSLADLIGKYAERDCGTSQIREVVLYQSKLRAQGAEYIARARIPLGGRKEEARDGK
jgi:RNA 2',3'-cyclic 3'-phosphodiesterase